MSPKDTFSKDGPSSTPFWAHCVRNSCLILTHSLDRVFSLDMLLVLVLEKAILSGEVDDHYAAVLPASSITGE